ncbi:MAG: protein kinase [Polyangiaceae bacterium]|nr:protein kinase [Polyangiaceae bacterium]
MVPRANPEAEIGLLGPYSILATLGRGGMGVVYRARHRESSSLVALKTVPRVSSSRLMAIRREIRALSHLCHPGVVQIVDQGETDGRPWYAMELLEGRTLADYIDDLFGRTMVRSGSRVGVPATQRLPMTQVGLNRSVIQASTPDVEPPSRRPSLSAWMSEGPFAQTLQLLERVCAALAYVHANGIVHRDLKPENIFLRGDSDPVLVDFGVAGRFCSFDVREHLEAGSGFAGSIPYMSPEQIRGELVDARADLYSIGCIIYECLTGQVPFVGEAGEVVWQHLEREPLAPSAISRAVDPGLDELVLRLLSKRPQNRIGYADIVGEMLYDASSGRTSSRRQPRYSYLYRPSFARREALMGALEQALIEATQGHGALIVLDGVSGSGKTRTGIELTKLAVQSGFNVATGECKPQGPDGGHATALAPFHPILTWLADLCRSEAEELTASVFGERGPVLVELEPAIGSLPGQSTLPEPADLGPELNRERLLNALLASLTAAADHQTTLLVIDDLQWADELSIALLEKALRSGLEGHRLLVLGTHRTDEPSARLQRLFESAGPNRLALEPLDRDQVVSMISGMLALEIPPDALVDYVHRESQGNPLFVAECLHAAIDEGLLVRQDQGQWTVAANASVDEIPRSARFTNTVQSMFLRRIGNLSAQARHVLDVAAVFGGEAQPEWIASAAGFSENELLEALQALDQRRLLENTETGLLRFTHRQLQRFVYGALDESARVAMHRAAAETLESYPGRGPDDASMIAAHWAKTGESLKASRYWRSAGDRYAVRGANEDAATCYQEALREVRKTEPGSTGQAALLHEILERLGETQALVGRHDDAQRTFEEALTTAGDDPLAQARLHRKVGKVLTTTKAHTNALKHFDHAAVLLGTLNASQKHDERWWDEWVTLQTERVWTHYWLGDTQEMAELIDAARPVVLARGTANHRAQFLGAMVNARMRQERYHHSRETVALASQALAASREAGNLAQTYSAQFVLGFVLLFHGSVHEAAHHLEQAVQGALQIGDVPLWTRAQSYLAVVRRRRGDVVQCEQEARDLLGTRGVAQMTDYIGVAEANLAWVAWKAGDLAGVKAHGEAALKAWDHPPALYPFQWLARWPLLAAAAAAGSVPDAAEHLRALLDSRHQTLDEATTSAIRQVLENLARGDGDAARAGIHALVEHGRRSGEL